MSDEIETVLANWIGQALSGTGRLPQGAETAEWIAARFAGWWSERAEGTLGEADRAASELQKELTRLGGWESFGEAMHELCHLRDALTDLRTILGLDQE